LLAEIQRLAIASVPEQTGQLGSHEVRTFADDGVWSVVSAYNASNATLYHSYVSIEADGAEMPNPQAGPGAPSTLSEQRDQLAQWIAANRKQEAA